MTNAIHHVMMVYMSIATQSFLWIPIKIPPFWWIKFAKRRVHQNRGSKFPHRQYYLVRNNTTPYWIKSLITPIFDFHTINNFYLIHTQLKIAFIVKKVINDKIFLTSIMPKKWETWNFLCFILIMQEYHDLVRRA